MPLFSHRLIDQVLRSIDFAKYSCSPSKKPLRKKTRYRYLTMAELLVAIMLSAILFSTVILWMQQQASMRMQASAITNLSRKNMHLELLLGELFAKIVPIENSFKVQGNQILSFVTRLPLSQDLAFRDKVQVDLLFDAAAQTLTMQQRPFMSLDQALSTKNMKQETLLEGVEMLHWQLLDAHLETFLPVKGKEQPQLQLSDEEKNKIPNMRLMEDVWMEKTVPMMIRLEVCTLSGDRDFVFTPDCRPLGIDLSLHDDGESA